MLRFRKHGKIAVDQNIDVIIDRLYRSVDTEYYSNNQHKWPSNNIEFRLSGKSFYGYINKTEFYISGKHKLLKEKFDDIEINGKFIAKTGSTLVEYEINSKPKNLLILFIINIVLIAILFFIPYVSGLESEKIKGYIAIPFILIFLNISIPMGLQNKIRQGEKKIREILTTS